MKTLFAAAAGAFGLMLVGIGTASAASPAYCDGVAREYANSRAGGSAVAGGVVGGVVGGVLGKAIGGKKGVAPGIIAGGATGVVAGSATWRKWYNTAYYNCINAPPVKRVYVEPQPVYALPPVGSRAWKNMCAQKYRSYDWYSDTFVGFDGVRKRCLLP